MTTTFIQAGVFPLVFLVLVIKAFENLLFEDLPTESVNKSDLNNVDRESIDHETGKNRYLKLYADKVLTRFLSLLASCLYALASALRGQTLQNCINIEGD